MGVVQVLGMAPPHVLHMFGFGPMDQCCGLCEPTTVTEGQIMECLRAETHHCLYPGCEAHRPTSDVCTGGSLKGGRVC